MRDRCRLRLAGLFAAMLGPIAFVACGNVSSTSDGGGTTGSGGGSAGQSGASGAAGSSSAGHSGSGGTAGNGSAGRSGSGGGGGDALGGRSGSGGAGGHGGATGSGGADASQCIPACTTEQLCCEEPLHGATDGPRTQWTCVTTSSTTICPAFP